ncbi:MAG TPA: PfkB family carbohydrate kinase [Ktedonobacterales bacterium]|jgi:sugar/nucleoside kinase (ribokinase family)
MSSANADLTTPPDFLVIGHITKDILPDGGYTIGGTATYAALAAQRLGWRAGIVTSVSPDLLARLPETLPGVAVAARPAAASSTFANIYEDGQRRQYLRARAESLGVADVPAAWRQARIVLLGPLAQEVAPELAGHFEGALIGATPQGWLRQWDSDGLISPTPWASATAILPKLDALILSRDDVTPRTPTEQQRQEAAALLQRWAEATRLMVVTQGAEGALLHWQGATRRFPAYPAQEVEPTGAGDVFAAAFLLQYALAHDPYAATRYANCAASFVVEKPGTEGIPTPQQVGERLKKKVAAKVTG